MEETKIIASVKKLYRDQEELLPRLEEELLAAEKSLAEKRERYEGAKAFQQEMRDRFPDIGG